MSEESSGRADPIPYDYEGAMSKLQDNMSKTGRVGSINALAQKFASDLLRGPLAEHFVNRFCTGDYRDATTTDIDAKKLAIWAFAAAEKIVDGQEKRVATVLAEMQRSLKESP